MITPRPVDATRSALWALAYAAVAAVGLVVVAAWWAPGDNRWRFVAALTVVAAFAAAAQWSHAQKRAIEADYWFTGYPWLTRPFGTVTIVATIAALSFFDVSSQTWRALVAVAVIALFATTLVAPGAPKTEAKTYPFPPKDGLP